LSAAHVIVIALAAFEGGWLAFDGVHALRTGNYVTPKDGPYAGRLGPWAGLLRAVGVDPRARAVKIAHLVIGGAWLIATLGFAAGVKGSAWAMVACAASALWYLPFGTVLSVVQIVLLLAAPRA